MFVCAFDVLAQLLWRFASQSVFLRLAQTMGEVSGLRGRQWAVHTAGAAASTNNDVRWEKRENRIQSLGTPFASIHFTVEKRLLEEKQ